MIVSGAVPSVVVLLLGASPPAQSNLVEPRDVQVVRQLLSIPEKQIDIGAAALVLSAMIDPSTDVNAGVAMLDELAKVARQRLAGRADPATRIRTLNTVLKEQGFKYDLSDMMGRNVRNRLLWGLLTRHKGNCVTLPVLWYSVAQRLDFPVFGVLAPQHMFLRYDDGAFSQNIEATSGGGQFTDRQLIEEMEIPDEAIKAGSMMRSLSRRELLVELIVDIATAMLNAKNYDSAIALLELALENDKSNLQPRHRLQRTGSDAYGDQAFVERAGGEPEGERDEVRRVGGVLRPPRDSAGSDRALGRRLLGEGDASRQPRSGPSEIEAQALHR